MSILNNFLRTYVANAMKLSKNNLQGKLRLEVIKDLSNKFQELLHQILEICTLTCITVNLHSLK